VQAAAAAAVEVDVVARVGHGVGIEARAAIANGDHQAVGSEVKADPGGRPVGAVAVPERVDDGLAQGDAHVDRVVALQPAGAAHAHGELLDVVEGGVGRRPRIEHEPRRPRARGVAAESPQPQGLRIEVGHLDHAIMDEPARPLFRKTCAKAGKNGILTFA